MDFFLLVLLTLIMMIRPEELFPDVTGWRLYLWTAVLTTLTAWPKLMRLLTLEELSKRSIAVCVLGFYASLFVSGATSGHWGDFGEEYCGEFAKVALSYFLMVAILDTPERLSRYLGWLVLCVGCVALVAVLHYYEVADFPLLKPTLIEKYTDRET